MNPSSYPTRINHLTAHSCLLIAVLAGSACSGKVSHPSDSTNQAVVSPDSAESAPPVQGPLTEPSPNLQSDSNRNDSVAQDTESQGANTDPETDRLKSQIRILDARSEQQLKEILALYRRLHIELNDSGRSLLIVDLFGDPRLEIQLLGFELVDRDLSGSTELMPEVGESAKAMLNNPSGEIRSKAARLITRLVPPDALIVLTESLRLETDPIAAEPMLMGVARWPSPEAVEPVLRWFLRNDAPFAAACNAAWSIEQAGHWDLESHRPQLLDRLRSADPLTLREAGMKLIARIGDASDLRTLLALLQSQTPEQQQWAANALVETPRAVELLVQAAESDNQLFRAASDSLILHRATPEGLRRLVSLPYPDIEAQTEVIVRMGAALENERLAEAVHLAGLDTRQSVLLLNRLLNGNVEITPRVAKGIIRLAEIELDELRPNRVIEAAIALDNVAIDPSDKARIDSYKSISLILLGKLEEAMVINSDPELWYASLLRTPDIELRKRIAGLMMLSFSDSLSPERLVEIRSVSGIVEPEEQTLDEDPAATTDPLDTTNQDE